MRFGQKDGRQKYAGSATYGNRVRNRLRRQPAAAFGHQCPQGYRRHYAVLQRLGIDALTRVQINWIERIADGVVEDSTGHVVIIGFMTGREIEFFIVLDLPSWSSCINILLP